MVSLTTGFFPAQSGPLGDDSCPTVSGICLPPFRAGSSHFLPVQQLSDQLFNPLREDSNRILGDFPLGGG